MLSAEPLGDSHAATPYDLLIQPHRIGLRDQCPRPPGDRDVCVFGVSLGVSVSGETVSHPDAFAKTDR